MPSITPFLWFKVPLEEPVAYYSGIFEDMEVEYASSTNAAFEIAGQRFMALHGGPQYDFNDAVSFFIECEDQAEVDYYWNALTVDGGAESMCGWLRDRYGLSWQVIPKALMRYLRDPDRAKADRVMEAMLQMKRIEIAALDEAARASE